MFVRRFRSSSMYLLLSLVIIVYFLSFLPFCDYRGAPLSASSLLSVSYSFCDKLHIFNSVSCCYLLDNIYVLTYMYIFCNFYSSSPLCDVITCCVPPIRHVFTAVTIVYHNSFWNTKNAQLPINTCTLVLVAKPVIII